MDRLERLLAECPTLFRGGRTSTSASAFRPTGYAELDALLPGAGWPMGRLIEIQTPAPGLAEIRLLLPALRQMQAEGRWVIWVAPPYRPYPPGLAQAGLDLSRALCVDPATPADLWWCLEKLLHHPACGIVMAWPSRCDNTILRRLQLAVEAGGALGALFLRQTMTHSPAAVRLQLAYRADALWVHVHKARGSWKEGCVPLGRADAPASS